MKNIIRNIALLLIPFLLSGCIKENRTECPSILILDLSKADTNKMENITIYISEEGGNLVKELKVLKENFSKEIEVTIKKGKYNVYSWGNIGTNSIVNFEEQSIKSVPGKDADPLYHESKKVTAYSETTKERLIPLKKFINLKIQLKGIDKNSPYTLFFEGETEGYHFNGEKIEGKSTIPLKQEDYFTANITDQIDYKSLKLLINNDMNNIAIPIGELILKDPPPDFPKKLSDITMIIDFSESTICIKIDGWKEILENFCKYF